MHERKHAMFERSEAFVALPGGLGTVEEIVEIMTWAQLGQHRKPIVFANVTDFWNPTLLDHLAHAGFLHSRQLIKPLVIESVNDIISAAIAAAPDAPGSDDDEHIEKILSSVWLLAQAGHACLILGAQFQARARGHLLWSLE